MLYNIAHLDGKPDSVTLFHEGKTHVATKDHRAFGDLIAMLTKKNHDDAKILEVFNLGKAIANKFTQLSERVALRGDVVLFDADPMDNRLTELIVQRYYNGGAFEPLVLFMEKIGQNPLAHSREQCFTWLFDNDFWLTDDGDFIGYKGVYPREDGFESGSSGRAFVNGELHVGKIPTTPGVIVEMPRSEVQHDPRQACSSGLHVGNWSYASGFGPVTLAVKVNPRDVVSVPSSETAKMRVCRYRVLGPVTERQQAELQLGEDAVHKTMNWATGPRSTKGASERVVKGGRLSDAVRTAKAERQAEKDAAKKPTTKKPVVSKKAEAKAPRYYDDFKMGDFRNRDFIDFKTMQWLAKEWGIKVPAPRNEATYVAALAAEATRRRRIAAKTPKSADKPVKVKAVKH